MIDGFCQHVVLADDRLGDAIEALAAFLQKAGVPAQAAHDVLVATDEIGANAMMHAYEDVEGAWLSIRARVGTEQISIDVEDGGRAFDPLAQAAPDTSAALDERAIGGLGIMLVRHLMDTAAYQRIGECNRLSLTRRLER